MITIYQRTNGQLSPHLVAGHATLAVVLPAGGEGADGALGDAASDADAVHVKSGAAVLPATPEACADAIWLDLVNPSRDEERSIEEMTGIQVPTREEMAEIELSSRLYFERGAHYMTANIVYAVDSPEPQGTAMTFILSDRHLITVRYAEPRAVRLFLNRANAGDTPCDTPLAIMVGLLEAIIDREADLIERLQLETEKIAQNIFEMKGGQKSRTARFDVTLRQVGRVGEISAKVRESLLSLGRLITYVTQVVGQRPEAEAIRQRLRTEEKDVQSLTDHVQYLTNRINFMLDATLGMATIEQNQIIKLFSVAAVMLMPPTLIASIYGMNFHHMPELAWAWGYPSALVLMVASALGFYLYFRRRGWL